MPSLVLGPLLRYVGETDAVVWVETDAPCEVEVLGTRERTFCVCGHHYALVCCGGLEPGTWHEYEVRLDGERVWPVDDGFPPSAFRTYPEGGRRSRSCSAPAAWPRRTSRPTRCARTRTRAGARSTRCTRSRSGCATSRASDWPDVLLMLGDQVYADEVSPATRAFIESRRDPSEPPGERVVDFEEYTRALPRELGRPDDPLAALHRLDGDDLRRPRRPRRLEHLRRPGSRRCARTDWWNEHIVARAGVLLGLPAPRQPRARRPRTTTSCCSRVKDGRRRASRSCASSPARPTDETVRHALELLPRPRPHAPGGDRLARRPGARGGQALDARRRGVGLDRRARHGRLRPPARRHLAALAARAAACTTSRRGARPWPAAPGASALAPLGERLRQAGRPRALGRLPGVVRAPRRAACARWPPASAAPRRPRSWCCPATCTTPTCARSPSGAASGVRSHVWQAVCSPYRNPLEARERRVIRLGMSRAASRSSCARSGRARPACATRDVRWRMVGDGPWFDNQVATLRIDGRAIELRLEKAVPVDDTPRASSGCSTHAGLSAQLSRRSGLFWHAPSLEDSMTRMDARGAGRLARAACSVGATGAQAKLVKLTGTTHGHAVAAGHAVPGQPRRDGRPDR